MTGIVAPLHVPAAVGGGTPALSNATVSSNMEVARYQLTSAGEINGDEDAAGYVDIGDWLAPKVGMSGFEVRATLVTGQIQTGASDALNSWLNLGTSRSWKCRIPTPSNTPRSAQLTIEIRPTGGLVAASCTVNLSAISPP